MNYKLHNLGLIMFFSLDDNFSMAIKMRKPEELSFNNNTTFLTGILLVL